MWWPGTPLLNRIRPKDLIAILRTVLPAKYSPLQPNGNGIQSVYLTEISEDFAQVLGGLIGEEARRLMAAQRAEMAAPAAAIHTGDDLDVWEHRLEQQVEKDKSIQETVREAIIRARRGQGIFKDRVMLIEKSCRITGVTNPVHLVASHCKPWRDSKNDERLDGENGLLLTPSIDHLFDRGFIGFEDSGDLIISRVAHLPSLQRMGVETGKVVNVGGFTEGQRKYLEFHRTAVLLRAAR